MSRAGAASPLQQRVSHPAQAGQAAVRQQPRARAVAAPPAPAPTAPARAPVAPARAPVPRPRPPVPVAAPPPDLLAAFPTVEQLVGGTPIVRLQHLPGNTSNVILAKLEGHNPAGSAKDRPALHMLREAERRGQIKRGDTIIEATSGNTGIALAMAAAIRGYKLKLILPASSSNERIATMTAYGAEVILSESMEGARDILVDMERKGLGHCLDQYNNTDNTDSHYRGTGPEIWQQTGGRVTHIVSSMGTFGTIMGAGKYLKERKPSVQVVGLQPCEKVSIPGIRRWSPGYVPSLYKPEGLDRVLDITAREAEETARCLARTEGIFAGISGAGAVSGALRLSAELENAVIVAVVCDKGDRYLSTGVFDAAAAASDPAPCLAAEFHSALARLIHGHAGPHYVLFRHGVVEGGVVTDAPGAGAAEGAGEGEAARAALAGARAVVEAGGGRLLEVVVADDRQLHELRQSIRRKYGGFYPPSLPSLAAWDRYGPGHAVSAEALEACPSPEAASLLVRKFVRDTWDDPSAPSADWQEPGHGAFVEEWFSEGLGV